MSSALPVPRPVGDCDLPTATAFVGHPVIDKPGVNPLVTPKLRHKPPADAADALPHSSVTEVTTATPNLNSLVLIYYLCGGLLPGNAAAHNYSRA
jgi:hypothetical protein